MKILILFLLLINVELLLFFCHSSFPSLETHVRERERERELVPVVVSSLSPGEVTIRLDNVRHEAEAS